MSKRKVLHNQMIEAKPIVVIYLPENFTIGAGGMRNAPMELMEALNGNYGWQVPSNKTKYNDYWKDYYWFCFSKSDIDAPEFKVFYEKDFTPIQFEELKQMITNATEQPIFPKT